MLVSWIKSVLHAIHGSFSRNIFGVQASGVSFFAIYIAFVLRLENVLLARFPPSYPFSSFLRDSFDWCQIANRTNKILEISQSLTWLAYRPPKKSFRRRKKYKRNTISLEIAVIFLWWDALDQTEDLHNGGPIDISFLVFRVLISYLLIVIAPLLLLSVRHYTMADIVGFHPGVATKSPQYQFILMALF